MTARSVGLTAASLARLLALNPSGAPLAINGTPISGGSKSGRLLYEDTNGLLQECATTTDATGDLFQVQGATFNGNALRGINAAGTNVAAVGTTLVNSLSTGNANNSNLVFQVGVKTTSGANQATATTALTLAGETLAASFAGSITSTSQIIANGNQLVTQGALAGVIVSDRGSSGSGWEWYGVAGNLNLFDLTNSVNSLVMSPGSSGVLTLIGSVQTAAPTGATAGHWKLGSLVTGAVTLDITRSVFVDIGGVVYKFMVAQ